jgi:hypothetical protein
MVVCLTATIMNVSYQKAISREWVDISESSDIEEMTASNYIKK